MARSPADALADSQHMSDYTDAEAEEAGLEAPKVIPARVMKKGEHKKKAGGSGKKGKVFASLDKMLELVDGINDEQDKKVNVLIERDVQPIASSQYL